jgi:hypothetical protein
MRINFEIEAFSMNTGKFSINLHFEGTFSWENFGANTQMTDLVPESQGQIIENGITHFLHQTYLFHPSLSE